ncbi:hypothetical protein HMPREF1315_0610 [Bifidobacterium longum subsp. longum 2-2B]|uniref:Uncharacterized protein n=1 Tax=Bifidobacterium longum subsp. longum 2-2B TaxID=1161745 RepID=A0AAV3FHT7_BIFLL|nr:hypothetical protein HMPREF1315_0610 [Bifidobacterium longum subsp. longum 2-2B]
MIQPYVDPEVLAEDARAAERRKHRRRMSHEHIRRIKRKKRIRMVLIVIGALLLTIAALAAWLGLSALKAKNEVEAAIQAASRIQSQVQAGDADKRKPALKHSPSISTLRMRRPSSRYGNWPHWCPITVLT